MKLIKKAIPAKLHIPKDQADGRWFVYYSFQNPKIEKMERFKVYDGFSDCKTIEERHIHGKRSHHKSIRN
jgi:hypothetical protein